MAQAMLGNPALNVPAIFLLHHQGDAEVRLFHDRERAESTMEAHDLEQWTVYDGEGFRRALSARGDGAVEIGPRVGGPEMSDLLRHLRAYLGCVQPSRDWEIAPFDELMKAAEQANREADAVDARRSRKIVLVLALVGLPLIAWFAKRWLAGRSGHGR